MMTRKEGKKQERNAIASVQRNLKLMRQQAQEYIDKHHTNLPPICTGRHYLFHSLQKPSEQKNANLQQFCSPISKKSLGKLVSDHSSIFNEDKNNPRPTVYNLQFKNFVSLHSEYSSNRLLMNSTSMRMKMNDNWKNNKKNRMSLELNSSKTSLEANKSREQLNTIVMNAKTIDFMENNPLQTNKSKIMVPARTSRTDLSQRQSEIISKYNKRFVEPSILTKTKKEKPAIQQLHEEQKELIKTRKKFHNLEVENPQMITFKKSIYKMEKKAGLTQNIMEKKQKVEKKKQPEIKYTPWEDSTGPQYEDFLGIDKF